MCRISITTAATAPSIITGVAAILVGYRLLAVKHTANPMQLCLAEGTKVALKQREARCNTAFICTTLWHLAEGQLESQSFVPFQNMTGVVDP